MEDRWVISLGAGHEQIPLIRAIQAEGYMCLAFDKDEAAPGFKVADSSFRGISNRDVGEMIRAIEGGCWTHGSNSRIAGVMAAASEVPDVMAILGHRLGCQNIPVSAGMLLKDKLRYKEVLKAAGVPHTEAHVVYEGSAKELFDRLKYEVVVKPQRGSGSRGVTINRHNPMALSIDVLNAEAVCPDVIMERYEAGPQISSETLIWDGMAVTVAFVERFYEEDSVKEHGGCMPTKYDHLKGQCNLMIRAAAEALGITRGTLKCDLVLAKDGPKIIECTARLSGGPLSEIVKRSSGVDYLRQAVRLACGDDPIMDELLPKKREFVSVDMKGNELEWTCV